MEFRRKCNVCGKIYCYSDKDLSDNFSNSAMAAVSAVGALASVFGGTRLDTYALNNQGDRYSDKVVDYNRCPSCHSSNTSPLTGLELEEMKNKENATAQSQIPPTRKIEINSNATLESLLKRTKMFLEEEDWDSAAAYCEHILDADPECAMAYVYKLMSELHVSEQDNLSLLKKPFSDEKSYKKAIGFADESLRTVLEGYNKVISERNTEEVYLSVINRFNSAKNEQDCKALIPKFKELGDYKNSEEMVHKCVEKAEEYRKDEIYNKAISMACDHTIFSLEDAVKEFAKIPGWRDADQKKIETINRVDQLKKAENKRKIVFSIVGCVLIVAAIIAIVIIYNGIKKQKVKQEEQRIELEKQEKIETYNKAVEYFKNEEYDKALEWFKKPNMGPSSNKYKSASELLAKLGEDSIGEDVGNAYACYKNLSLSDEDSDEKLIREKLSENYDIHLYTLLIGTFQEFYSSQIGSSPGGKYYIKFYEDGTVEYHDMDFFHLYTGYFPYISNDADGTYKYHLETANVYKDKQEIYESFFLCDGEEKKGYYEKIN